VKNVVRPHDSTAEHENGNGKGNGTSSGKGVYSSSDRGNSADGEGSANPLSQSSISASTSSGGAFGHLMCRKRKTPKTDDSAVKVEAGTTGGDKEADIDGERKREREGEGQGQGELDQEQASKRVKLESSTEVSSTDLDGSTSKGIVGQGQAAGGKEEGLRSCLESAVPESTDIIVKNDFGSEVLKVSFTADMWDRLMVPPVESPDTVTDPSSPPDKYSQAERAAYGVKYNFSLKDKAEEAAVDAPEWLVPQVLSPPPQTLKQTHTHRPLHGAFSPPSISNVYS
jgi:hypothetical protein